MLNDLIFDRTADDVANKTAKGLYRYTDLNRVQNAIVTICDRYREAGYDAPEYTFTTWAVNAIPRASDMTVYLNAVAKVRNLVTIPKRPTLPTSMNALKYTGANNIEKALWMADEAMDRIEGAWYYCDEVFAGEVDV